MSETQTLRLTLDSGDFIGNLRKVSQATDAAGKKGQKSFKAMSKGLDAAKRSAAGLGSKLKSGVALVGSLGAAMVGVGTVKAAVSLDAQYRKLAFSIRVATKEAHTTAQVQGQVNQAAADSARTSEEMAGAFAEVFGATKDLKFTQAILSDIGVAATGAHEEVAVVAEVAQKMSRKFGVSAANMKDALAQVVEGAKQGGPSFGGMSGAMDAMGATMIAAGLKGQRGLDFMIGSLNATDGEMEGLGAQVAGLKQLFQKLGDPGQLANLAKKAGLSGKQLVDEKDALQRIQMVLKKGKKGMDALKATFIGPEERDALRILFTDPFDKSLKRAKASGLKGRDAIEQASRFAEEGMKSFGKATFDGAALQKEADKEMKSPQASMRRAMEALTTSFADPAIIGAVDDLAENMPMLAKMFGNVVSFAAKNPILAGALGIGGHLGSSFFAGAAKEAGTALTDSFRKQMASTGAGFGQTALATLNKGSKGWGALAGVGIAASIVAILIPEIDKAFGRSRANENKMIAMGAGLATRAAPKSEKERQTGITQARAVMADFEAGQTLADKWSEQFAGTHDFAQKTRLAAYEDAKRRETQLLSMGTVAPAAPAAAGAVASPAARGGGSGGSGLNERLVASEMTNALAGVTLTVKLDTHGVPVTNVGGGSGPRSLPPTVQGGGL